MKTGSKKLFLAGFALLFLWLVVETWAQTFPGGSGAVPMGSGSKLSSVKYCDPPNEQQIDIRLTGAEMAPLAGTLYGMYGIKELKIEKFRSNGTVEAVAEAPQCVYAPMDGVASSTGHLDLTLGNGKIHLQGEGFLWIQNESRLTISNQVSTVIKMGNWKLTNP